MGSDISKGSPKVHSKSIIEKDEGKIKTHYDGDGYHVLSNTSAQQQQIPKTLSAQLSSHSPGPSVLKKTEEHQLVRANTKTSSNTMQRSKR